VSPRAPRHQDHHPAGLRYRHVSCVQTCLLVREGSEAATCPMGLGLGRARAFLRYLTSGSSWPHKARGADSALNVYVTGHTWCMADIKCVQDIDTVEQ
jgi:hypothetical protein